MFYPLSHDDQVEEEKHFLTAFYIYLEIDQMYYPRWITKNEPFGFIWDDVPHNI